MWLPDVLISFHLQHTSDTNIQYIGLDFQLGHLHSRTVSTLHVNLTKNLIWDPSSSLCKGGDRVPADWGLRKWEMS